MPRIGLTSTTSAKGRRGSWGGAGFTVWGEPGNCVRSECSHDLLNWVEAASVALPANGSLRAVPDAGVPALQRVASRQQPGEARVPQERRLRG